VTIVASSETQRAVFALGYLSGAGQTEPRTIPPGISPASADGSGGLGWTGAVQGCLDTTDLNHDNQLLNGWSYAESDGRWTEQSATAVIATEDRSDQHLSVTGINHRPDAFTMTIGIDGTPLTRQKLAAGPFRVAVALPPTVKSGRHTVAIATDSAYQPSTHGQGDTRRLGVYVSTICVQ